MSKARGDLSALKPFLEDELITGVVQVIQSGKEATVYRCRAQPGCGEEFLAAKVYHPRRYRSFQNDALYREGRLIPDKRLRRAVRKKTRTGREAQFGMWLGHEFATLSALHRAGADVPRPHACAESAILMEYLGDGPAPAPQLSSVTLEPDQARPLFDRLLHNIELWLACNHVHADLSPYNVLYWRGSVRVIDFPQSVDPRSNRNALALLERDLANLCDYFEAYGIQANPCQLARRFWQRTQGGIPAGGGLRGRSAWLT